MSRSAEFLNPNVTPSKMTGPDGKIVVVAPKTKVILPEFFIKYTPRKLRLIRFINTGTAVKRKVVQRSKPDPKYKAPVNNSGKPVTVAEAANAQLKRSRSMRGGSNRNKTRTRGRHRVGRPNTWRSKTVGKADLINSQNKFTEIATNSQVPISNNIGVGILSFNRFESLKRLILSLVGCTDLKRTTVFVSDESSTLNREQLNWLQSYDIVVLHNQRIGIAGNTNRLMRCLDRFKYKFILNDDVEILSPGWEDFYVNAIKQTGIHHFCFRQPGVYGANESQETTSTVKSIRIRTVHEKPHGAILVFDEEAFKAVGFFDENFGMYGMEHVDWSNRVARHFQLPGFHDPIGSENFFFIHNESSAVPDRQIELRKGRSYYEKVRDSRIHVSASEKSKVPSISVVIPYRNTGRSNSMRTVVNNIKAQRFPQLEIILVEQDIRQHVNPNVLSPIEYLHVPSASANVAFNKSKAFNQGVIKASNEWLVLHDADIITTGDYLKNVGVILQSHTGCHFGEHVYYLNESSTTALNGSAALSPDYTCTRLVKYFEGGSLGMHRRTYFQVGGFNEAFVGYGVEDCCFYKRLVDLSKFANDRRFKFFHLHHGRTPGWNDYHNQNRDYYGKIQKVHPTSAQYAAMLRQDLAKHYPSIVNLLK